MSGDVMRQLDAYGNHVESSIDHVTTDELIERTIRPTLSERPARVRRRGWKPMAALGGVAVALAAGVAGWSYLSAVEDDVSRDFAEIGATLEDGGGAGRARAPVTTTAVPATTAAPTAAAFGPGDEAQLSAEQLLVTRQPQANRDIVFVADMTVAVSEADEAGRQATQLIEALGGFLSSERSTGGDNASNVLTFKVPPNAFHDAVDRLGELGVVRDRSISADDVTELVVDLESQIETAEISVDRLRVFLAEALNVNDVAKIERELTNRETELERLRGRLRTIEDRVALATIVVTFSEAIATPKVQLSVSAYPSIDDAGASCPGRRPVEVDAGDAITVCVQVTNNGKTSLSDIELSGPALEMLPDGLVHVEGDIAGVVEPGGSVVVAAELEIDERIRADLTVTAIPLNEVGATVAERSVAQTKRLAIDLADPGGLPGFGDAWSRGVSWLATAGGVALIALGVVLPWLWLPALLLGVVWWRRRS